MLWWLAVLALAQRAYGHATLLTPAPRWGDPMPYQRPVPGFIPALLSDPSLAGKTEYRGTDLWSIKLPMDEYPDPLALANAGCGGEANGDPGPQPPKVAYSPGSTIEVKWELGLAHYPLNATGIRVALNPPCLSLPFFLSEDGCVMRYLNHARQVYNDYFAP